MKRWNQKGSVYAHRRMAELRYRKGEILKSEAITEWSNRTGRDGREWWTAAQNAGLTSQSTLAEKIAFLKGES